MAVVYRSLSLPPSISAPIDTFSWCLFDTRVDLLDFEPFEPSATMTSSTTSNNRTVRASLRLAAPPSSSVVQLYTDDDVRMGPSVVAADGNLLLIHMAGFDWPWMKSLPPPPDWVAWGEDTGIIKMGECFVVASLKPRVIIDRSTRKGVELEVEVAFVWIFRSGTNKWDIRQLDMPHDSDNGLVEFHWQTDAVFSFDEFMCWVDYHRGILLCDVCNSDPELRFLRFPGIEIWRCGDRALPTRFRTVSICKGRMKFVDVDNGRFRSTENDDNRSTESNDIGSTDSDDNEHCNGNGCSITTWTLKMPQYKWEKDYVLQIEELWSQQSYQDSRLQKIVPTFPVVSMEKPDILHLIVKEPGFYKESWMITIDMKKKTLGPYQLYKNPVNERGGVVLLTSVTYILTVR
ncbi:unnamed protein product [Urochloa decumbens]|uniref:DUF1618 domain-containing protein n=1 Tax=Urochloa decumbens TaxID=240449 RepID=A0ABC8VP15_9POAL